MNNEMEKVDIWLQANGLVINHEKTHYMVFHRARIKTQSNEVTIFFSKLSFKYYTLYRPFIFIVTIMA